MSVGSALLLIAGAALIIGSLTVLSGGTVGFVSGFLGGAFCALGFMR